MNSIMQNAQRQMLPQQQQDALSPTLINVGGNNGMNSFPQQQKVTPRFQGMGNVFVSGLPGQQMNLMMGMDNSLNGVTGMSGMTGMSEEKRKLVVPQDDQIKPLKKQRTEEIPANLALNLESDDTNAPAPVVASKEGLAFFDDNDVLSGRGGGTNVHPGNRTFRDLINLHRRAYLKARKNDKPAISRAIVRKIRETGGRFLKKDEKSGMWYEIGDDSAREKTSQALRQRAPEMRKLLFDTEREEARAAAEEHIRQQRLIMGGVGNQNPVMGNQGGNGMGNVMNTNMNSMNMNTMNMNGINDMSTNGMMNPSLFQAMAGNKLGGSQDNNDFSQMFSAAILQGGINRFASNGA